MKGQWLRKPVSASAAMVFVHGILSDGDACWRNEQSNAFWPDLVVAEPELADCGVYVFTYKTGFTSGNYRLGDVVDALKVHMSLDGVSECRRLIFVAHSMGGIVVRKFIVERAVEMVEQDKDLALFLVASPSLGAEYANLLEPLAKWFGHMQADALRFAQDNAWLMDLDKAFINLKESERLPIEGQELVEDCFFLARSLFRDQVVKPFSGARYFGDPYKVPHSDHGSISKPGSREAVQHRLLVQFADRWLKRRVRKVADAAPVVDEPPVEAPMANERGEPGLSHRLGSIHLHVDGASARDIVQDFAAIQGQHGRLTEIASVEQAIAGPQRQDLPGIYQLHTPGVEGQEALDYFSTTLLHAGEGLPGRGTCDAIAGIVNDLLSEFDVRAEDTAGTVLELERVVGTVDADGSVAMSPHPALPAKDKDGLFAAMLFAPFNKSDGRTPARATYELHFSLDIPRAAEPRQPVSLDELRVLSQEADLRLGGWFLFCDRERWAFRSNSFEAEVSAALLQERWERLHRRLLASPLPALRTARLRLLAEESLAVWKTPVTLEPDVLTLHRLATWERNVPDLAEFWVVLPNFLGDQNLRVAAAMRNNFKRGTRYVYFLRSNADAKRWLDFKAAMVEREPAAESLMNAYVVGFTDLGEWKNVAAFIANPATDHAEAVRLQIDAVSNQVRCGWKMPMGRVQAIVNGLKPVTAGGALASWHRVEAARAPSLIVAVCINLMVAPSEEVFEMLDSELAAVASTVDGEIALYGTKSITAVFDGSRIGVERALSFAGQVLQRAGGLGLNRYVVRAGVDFGEARQVPRACGMLWTGPAIRGCRNVLFGAEERPGIYVSRNMQEMWQATGGESIKELATEALPLQIAA